MCVLPRFRQQNRMRSLNASVTKVANLNKSIFRLIVCVLGSDYWSIVCVSGSDYWLFLLKAECSSGACSTCLTQCASIVVYIVCV